MARARRGYRSVPLPVKSEGAEVAVLMSPKRADALEKIVGDLPTFEGIKILDIMEAVYIQGHKDGAREVFERLDQDVATLRKLIPHRRPGRPRKQS